MQKEQKQKHNIIKMIKNKQEIYFSLQNIFQKHEITINIYIIIIINILIINHFFDIIIYNYTKISI